MTEIQEAVLRILKPYCKGSLDLESNLFENGIDSFNAVNVLVALERYYRITFTDEELDLRTIRTVYNLAALVKSKLESD